MKARGFSLLEMLLVVSIIMFLAAIASPALTEAKASANVRSSIARLQQFHKAVTIYMIDYEDASIPHNLPPADYVYGGRLGFNRDFFVSPCGLKPNPYVDGRNKFSYVFWNRENTPETYFQKYREKSMLLTDGDCNPSGVFFSPYTVKRGLGITQDGQLIVHYKRGEVTNRWWWNLPPD